MQKYCSRHAHKQYKNESKEDACVAQSSSSKETKMNTGENLGTFAAGNLIRNVSMKATITKKRVELQDQKKENGGRQIYESDKEMIALLIKKKRSRNEKRTFFGKQPAWTQVQPLTC